MCFMMYKLSQHGKISAIFSKGIESGKVDNCQLKDVLVYGQRNWVTVT